MLNKKRVIVIGAAGLLGSNLVSALIKHNATVVAVDIDLPLLKTRLAALGIDQKNTQLEMYRLDICDESAVKSFFNGVGLVSGAVNCSYPRNESYGKNFEEVTLATFNENMTLNIGSSFLFMQQCAEYFKRSKDDFSLVNISSIYGVIAPKFEIYSDTDMTMPVEYAAIKSALIHLSKYVVKYVCNSKFRINCVSPGGIYDGHSDEFCSEYKKQTLGNGMLDVKEVTGSVIYLLSDYSLLVNGQNIIIDDGFVL